MLFLDEIGDIPLELQPKLLRVLQEQEFERLGSNKTHKVDVRVVAATNRDLAGTVNRSPFAKISSIGSMYFRFAYLPYVIARKTYLSSLGILHHILRLA